MVVTSARDSTETNVYDRLVVGRLSLFSSTPVPENSVYEFYRSQPWDWVRCRSGNKSLLRRVSGIRSEPRAMEHQLGWVCLNALHAMLIIYYSFYLHLHAFKITLVCLIVQRRNYSKIKLGTYLFFIISPAFTVLEQNISIITDYHCPSDIIRIT